MYCKDCNRRPKATVIAGVVEIESRLFLQPSFNKEEVGHKTWKDTLQGGGVASDHKLIVHLHAIVLVYHCNNYFKDHQTQQRRRK